MTPPPPDAIRHRWYEDVLGLFTGVMMCATGLHVLGAMGFITGQMAGLALLLGHISGIGFGTMFFALNLPFYLFGFRKMGALFTIKSLSAVASLSILVELMPTTLPMGEVEPILGILIFGAITSVGLIAVFRHGASMGGMTIVALYLQDNGIAKAGHVQMVFDLCLFAMAVLLFPVSVVTYSLAGAVFLNLMIALNHRRDRYIAS